MTTPPGWEPRPGPTRGDPARRQPRGAGGWARDDGDPRRQGPRGGAPSPGRDGNAGPSFTPARGPASGRDAGRRDPRGPRSPGDGFEGGPRSSGSGRERPPGGPGSPARGYDNLQFGGSPLQSGGLTRWIGRMGWVIALLVLFAGAVLGIIIALAANQGPGDLLGFFIIVGSVVAVLGIQRGKIYLLFPVPALTFFVAAIVVGKVHDAKFGSSTIAVADGITQWIASIFFPAVVATILVLLIGGGRWLLGRQVVTGQFLLAQNGPPPRKPQAARRPAPARHPDRDDDPNRDSWADENPFADQVFKTEMIQAVRPDSPPKPERPARMGGGDQPPGTGPRPRQSGQQPRQSGQQPRQSGQQPRQSGQQPRQSGQQPRQSGQQPRPPRPVDRNDQWGGPRLQPPGTGPRPRQSGQQPRQSGQQPRAPRPSFNPNQRPQRPPHPNPPEGWTPR